MNRQTNKQIGLIFIVAPCILSQFTKKNQQMHLKSILSAFVGFSW
jgi:hypothetical protein